MLKKMILSSFLCNIICVQSADQIPASPRPASPNIFEFARPVSSRPASPVHELERSASPTHPGHIRFNTLPPSLSRLPNPEQLHAIKARQHTAAAADAKTEIGTVAALHISINQHLIYKAKPHNQIPIDQFYSKFPDTIDTIKAEAQVLSQLSADDENRIYDQLYQDSTTRIIGHFEIVGEQPILDGLHDKLFNINKARRHVTQSVIKFIDENYGQVKAECVSTGLTKQKPSNQSKRVRTVCSCGNQMHDYPCWQDCITNDVAHCSNSFCQKITTTTPTGQEKIIMYPLNWTPLHYFERSKAKYIATEEEIRDANCSICLEPLQQKSSIKKSRKK